MGGVVHTVDGWARADSFFAAGDTMLVAYCDVYNDARTAILCRVRVFRIYGGDASQMTLVSDAGTLLTNIRKYYLTSGSSLAGGPKRSKNRRRVCWAHPRR